jgi:hypothetical protein
VISALTDPAGKQPITVRDAINANRPNQCIANSQNGTTPRASCLANIRDHVCLEVKSNTIKKFPPPMKHFASN